MRVRAWQDHGPPLLLEMVLFCEEAAEYLLKDSENMIAVHCKVVLIPDLRCKGWCKLQCNQYKDEVNFNFACREGKAGQG